MKMSFLLSLSEVSCIVGADKDHTTQIGGY